MRSERGEAGEMGGGRRGEREREKGKKEEGRTERARNNLAILSNINLNEKKKEKYHEKIYVTYLLHQIKRKKKCN